MKNSPPWTSTYKISALRQLHPLVGRVPAHVSIADQDGSVTEALVTIAAGATRRCHLVGKSNGAALSRCTSPIGAKPLFLSFNS